MVEPAVEPAVEPISAPEPVAYELPVVEVEPEPVAEAPAVEPVGQPVSLEIPARGAGRGGDG